MLRHVSTMPLELHTRRAPPNPAGVPIYPPIHPPTHPSPIHPSTHPPTHLPQACKIGKLFAKHFKVAEQEEMLRTQVGAAQPWLWVCWMPASTCFAHVCMAGLHAQKRQAACHC